MAAVSTIIAGAALGVAGASAISANKNAKKQIAAQNEALAYERKQNDLSAARQRRDAVRSARQAFAQAQNTAANQGVMGSSSSEGGLGSIQSQLNDNVSFLDQYNFFSDQGSQALGRANMYAHKANTARTVGQIAGSVFMNSAAVADKITSFLPKKTGTG